MPKRKSFDEPPDSAGARSPSDKAAPATDARSGRKSSKKIGTRQLEDGGWELAHPRCALARSEDLDEVKKMIAAGENDIARDELRWLLAECHNFIAAHKLLGDLALAENDLRLARGHFGYAYQLALAAIEPGRLRPLAYAREANRDFFEAGKSLAGCLMKMGKRGMARDVVKQLLELDPGDPLELRKLKSDSAHQRGRRSGPPRRKRRGG